MHCHLRAGASAAVVPARAAATGEGAGEEVQRQARGGDCTAPHPGQAHKENEEPTKAEEAKEVRLSGWLGGCGCGW